MSGFHEQLSKEFADPEYRASYSDSFLDAWIALQIRAIREQRKMTQKQLADVLHTTQTAISRLENANYSGRSISTLKQVAKAFDCRLKVSFETYGSLIEESDKLCIEFLLRPTFHDELSAFENVPPDIRGQTPGDSGHGSSAAEMPRGEVNRLKGNSTARNGLERFLLGEPQRREAA